MAKRRRSGSSVQGKRAGRNAMHISKDKIDFSDIPELTDEELKQARRVGRPKSGREPKKLIAIRIDPVILEKIKDMARELDKNYQTLIHEILEKCVKEAA